MDDLLTVKEAAKKLRVSESTVREKIYSGQLKAIKMHQGKFAPVRISLGDLKVYVIEMPKM